MSITLTPLLRKAIAKAGQFTGFLWVRQLKTYNGIADVVTKEVRTVARVGLAQDSRESVKQARASGELPAVNQGLPWGEWAIFPYIIAHKGGLYLRFYPVSGRKPRVTYRLNGKPVSWSEVASLVTKADHPKESEPYDCFTIKAENLRQVR